MNALSELPSDLTTPLGGPDILYWFDALVDRRCTGAEFVTALLDLCSGDPEAAKQALLLLDHHANTGKLRLEDFRSLELKLQRVALGEAVTGEGPAHSADPTTLMPPARPTAPVRETDPTRAYVPDSAENELLHDIEVEATREFAADAAAEDELLRDFEVEATRALASRPHEDSEPFRDVSAGESPDEAEQSVRVLRGRYVLQDELGVGGMGTVYRAIDRNRAGLPYKQQYVAIKVLREEFARRPEALQSLRREFHQAQSLSHPGIVNVFDFDQDDGIHFVTMELLDGEPLSALMRRVLPNRLAREAAFRILRELGEAMVYAHGRDVLHLDLKPGNVMITLQGHVRVLDFGLAQTFMAEPWISESPPAYNAATPAYASCERLSGELPDVRDDIYSYSCIAYELLSGRHPFDRRSAVEARNARARPRRIRSLARSQWRALRRGLEWSREDRPASMIDLLDGLGLQADTPWASVTSKRVRPRRPEGSSRSFVTVGLLVLAALGYVGWTRLPQDYRDLVVEHASGWGEAVAQTTDDARAWAQAQYATWGGDEGGAASADLPAAVAASASTLNPAQSPGSTTAEPGAPPNSVSEAAVGPATGTEAATGSENQTTEPATEPPPTGAPVSPLNSLPTAPDPADTPVDASAAAATSPPPAESLSVADPRTTQVATRAKGAKTGGGPGELEFSASSYPVSESASMARLTVRRRGGARGEISFEWHTVAGSAVAAEDYAAPNRVREVMAAGQATTTLLVPIVADSVPEHTELFDVVIEHPGGGASLGAITHVPVIIVDDD